MSTIASLEEKLFDLGFAAGTDIDEDLAPVEFCSRVMQWRLGFILGQSYHQAAKAGNLAVYAKTAGRLGALYGVNLDELLDALKFDDGQCEVIRHAYAAISPAAVAT